MSTRPNFDELVGRDVGADERERLRRAHELLVAAGPPPELSPRLERAPAPPGSDVRFLPRRRRATWALLAAALAAFAFGGGYLVGADRSEPTAVAFEPVRVITLRGAGDARDATAVIRVGRRDDLGNLPMIVTVQGLRHLPEGDYYTLYMTENGRNVVTCGTFNVEGGLAQTTVEFSVAYPLDAFDGFAIAEYRSEGHRERNLLTGELTA